MGDVCRGDRSRKGGEFNRNLPQITEMIRIADLF